MQRRFFLVVLWPAAALRRAFFIGGSGVETAQTLQLCFLGL